ncbi:SafA/ExsA family spore coat assembly protein [Halobacillus sp. A5]|uniref:SafA/ExsA family spore coat assembly protein n=1 Tax=Halobacillus sp. A5 TaxID=2880263 RepID=UPI0020A641BD|nr:SafA/ExsA family spore coat assembly protein [Halobacillus sp. A5]
MRIHVVQKGDTLWKISKKYGVDFEELKSVNSQLSNPDMIMPGMKIKVPQGKKQVKKEAPKKEAPKKEMPKKEMPKKEIPKKEMPKPKPMPKIKEDENIPKPAPMMEKPMMPIQMNMPIQMPMDQHMQNYYTTFHLPQMPMPEKPKSKPKAAPKPKTVKPKAVQPKTVKPNEPAHDHQENKEYSPPKKAQQPVQELPYHQPMSYHPTPWDYFWCPPYPGMGMHHPHMNQPMTSPMANHPMGNMPMENHPMGKMPMANHPMGNMPMENHPMGNMPMANHPMGNMPMENHPMGNMPMANHPMSNMPMGNQPMPFMHGMDEGDDSENQPYMMGDSKGGCGCGGKKPMSMGHENQPPHQMMAPHMNGWFPMMHGNGQMGDYFPQGPQQYTNWENGQSWQDDEDED